MTDKPLPLLIGGTAALVIMVCIAVSIAFTTFWLVRAILCH